MSPAFERAVEAVEAEISRWLASEGHGDPAAIVRAVLAVAWEPIETAPKGGKPILGWCVHAADPYFIESADRTGREVLTLYGGHTEGLSHVEDGAHVLVWGGSWDDRTHEYDGGWMPDWWFLQGSEFEVTANPTHWMPIPPAPTEKD